MNLTIHLLIRNNEQDIEPTLQSLVALDAPILIGNQNSTDNTTRICNKFNTTIIPVSANDNSIAREILISNTKTKWALYLHPWEILAGGHRNLSDIPQGNSYLCQIFQNNLISKEIRLWNMSAGLHFINPVFETLYDPDATIFKELIIYNKKQQNIEIESIKKWKKKQPISPNPYYYEACVLLQQGKYQDFISIANHYLFMEKEVISAVMLKYYLAMVYCYQFKDLTSAMTHILPCLSIRPLMAEFWCLVGDIYYRQNDFQKAIVFYENALFLGGQRNLLDEWPIDVNKYKAYPTKMINSCSNIRQAEYYCHDLVDKSHVQANNTFSPNLSDSL